MPLIFEPGQEIEVWLDIDSNKPSEARPTFIAKAQSVRGQRRVDHIEAKWRDPNYFKDGADGIDQLYDEALELLGDLLVDWRNMNGMKFSKDAIEDLLTYAEVRELIRKINRSYSMTSEEKKSSD